jgi:hypothetical protein
MIRNLFIVIGFLVFIVCADKLPEVQNASIYKDEIAETAKLGFVEVGALEQTSSQNRQRIANDSRYRDSYVPFMRDTFLSPGPNVLRKYTLFADNKGSLKMVAEK